MRIDERLELLDTPVGVGEYIRSDPAPDGWMTIELAHTVAREPAQEPSEDTRVHTSALVQSEQMVVAADPGAREPAPHRGEAGHRHQ